jgi:hypothetical protein
MNKSRDNDVEWEKASLDHTEKWLLKMSYAEDENEIRQMRRMKAKEYRELRKIYNRGKIYVKKTKRTNRRAII